MEWVCQAPEDWIGRIAKGISKGLRAHIHELWGVYWPLPNKKKKKEKTKVEKKKKILTRLVVKKINKCFNVAKCWLVDDTFGNEFLGSFPFGNDPVPSVSIDVHRFKKTPANIVYHPLLDIHKDEIKKRITQCHKSNTKVPIFAILDDLLNVDHITPRKSKSGKIYRTISFWLLAVNT
jgi:hypothetical protein